MLIILSDVQNNAALVLTIQGYTSPPPMTICDAYGGPSYNYQDPRYQMLALAYLNLVNIPTTKFSLFRQDMDVISGNVGPWNGTQFFAAQKVDLGAPASVQPVAYGGTTPGAGGIFARQRLRHRSERQQQVFQGVLPHIS